MRLCQYFIIAALCSGRFFLCHISERTHSMPRYISVEGGIIMALTPDMIFSRMDARRAYSARRAETGQTVSGLSQAPPGPPQYAAPRSVQPSTQYAQPVQPLQYVPQPSPQYVPTQQCAAPPQYAAPVAGGFGMAAEPLTPPAMSAAPENLPPAPASRREADLPHRPRSGTYRQLMASHDRMGTRHLG